MNYLKNIACYGLLACSLSSFGQTDAIHIDLARKGAEVSPSMYGVFFEEINHAGEGGLYAELVKNRSFEELEMPEGYHAEGDVLYPKPVHNHITGEIKDERYQWTTEPVPGWNLLDGNDRATLSLTKERPKFASAPNNLKVTLLGSEKVSLANDGFWGMGVKSGENYHFRIICRPEQGYQGNITVRLLASDGSTLARKELKALKADEWNDVKLVLKADRSDAKAKLVLDFESKGVVYLDYVSLFPEETFHHRPNGLRKDVADMLTGLHPSFVRWPGGCVVEGITLDNRFEWKKTLGDPAARGGEYSTWGYRNTYGFGYTELLQFCEDIGAEAMYVCNVGIACQYRMGEASSEEDIEYYLNDCLDAIEYALGDISTPWGKKRAEAGHPEVFPLKYVEIGNENWGDEYDKRFDIFYKVIKAKYPQLTLISNHGMGGTGKIAKTDMIDPHWYVKPDYFLRNTTIFDQHPRGKYEVYIGEYAANQAVGGGNLSAALSEAAFITGMERNGDLVKMASYAPLLENRNNRNWPVNLIWLDTDKVVGRSSYYVQKMFAENKPTYNIGLDKTFIPAVDTTASPKQFFSAGYEQGSKDIIIKVVNADSSTYAAHFDIAGNASIEKVGEVISLSAKSDKVENSFDEPMKIAPVVTNYKDFDASFSYTFEPFSFTILRLKTKK